MKTNYHIDIIPIADKFAVQKYQLSHWRKRKINIKYISVSLSDPSSIRQNRYFEWSHDISCVISHALYDTLEQATECYKYAKLYNDALLQEEK